ncbi:hypothetical protein [Devosia lucknowensis]|uniref:hypothetical protein n=1 Tax=Devosia lucknowensis TaxID=1096929 RepID=UPI00111F0F67|nr:hypothetical protein [Devosia lucknowensis]
MPRPRRLVTIADSIAHRKPVRHRYGSVVGLEVDPFRQRGIYYESGLERDWLQVMIADPDVLDVREQQLLEVSTATGDVVKHYVDYVVTRTDGLVEANACKYEKDIDDELLDLLKQAAATVGDAFADEYKTLSEVGLSHRRVMNARQVIDCGKDFDFPAQDAIREAVPSFGPSVSLVELDAVVGDRDRGSRAAIALIQQGLFGVGPHERIGRVRTLRNLFTK